MNIQLFMDHIVKGGPWFPLNLSYFLYFFASLSPNAVNIRELVNNADIMELTAPCC